MELNLNFSTFTSTSHRTFVFGEASIYAKATT